MNDKYIWPTETPKIVTNFSNSGFDLMQEKFGALSQDPNNIYSRICIGNSTLSLEPFRGCPLQCSYCIANNDVRSLDINKLNDENISSMIVKKIEMLAPPVDLVNAAVKHPAFIPHKTIISFCTGSTEFFLPGIKEELWKGLLRLIELGYKNPIWIIVKSFLARGRENEWIEHFKFLNENGIKVVVSISDTGAPKEIEPFQIDRFKPFHFLKDTPVKISHHMRPIIPGKHFNGDTINEILNNSLDLVQSVCVGGLRVDPGMSVFWDHEITRTHKPLAGNQSKIFDQSITNIIRKNIEDRGKSVPVFNKTSEMLAYHLEVSDFNLYKYRNDLRGAFLNIGQEIIRSVESRLGECLETSLDKISSKIQLGDIKYVIRDGSVYITNEINYQEERALIHAIGHSGLFD